MALEMDMNFTPAAQLEKRGCKQRSLDPVLSEVCPGERYQFQEPQ